MKTKPRVIKDLESVDPQIIEDIIRKYPMGFAKYLVTFNDLKGKKVMALPYEDDEKCYMLKITKDRARAIMLTGAPTVSKEDEVFDIVDKEDAEEEVLAVEEVDINEEPKAKKKTKIKAKAKA